MAQPNRPFITCHVLDTVAGRPAVGVKVVLTLLAASPTSVALQTTPWVAVTDADGRVGAWQRSQSASRLPMASTALSEALDEAGPEVDDVIGVIRRMREAGETAGWTMWCLTFGTGEYFGKGKTFFPEVEIRFAVDVREEHYHVPLLLGPWSYTTYRGS